MTRPPQAAPSSPRIIAADAGEAIAVAARALRDGGVVAIPTDTVYGLAAAIDQPVAIQRLYALKGRPAHKAIPVLFGDPAALRLVARAIPPLAKRLARHFWPGALTLVVPSHEFVPGPLTALSKDGTRTVAVRVPDSAITRAIIREAGGALAVTSANVSGRDPALTAQEASALGSGGPDLVIDAGRVAGGTPSTIVEVNAGLLEILREGAITAAEIRAVAESEGADTDSIRFGAV